MSFQDIMKIMLPKLQGKYVPYINNSGGSISDIANPLRNDYDRIRDDDGTFHGGVDFYYGEIINGTLTQIGSKNQPSNHHPSVHAPVSGKVMYVGGGTVSILDDNGYIHTIRHMTDIPEAVRNAAINHDRINENDLIGKMSNVNVGGKDPAIHVHYEITTYYLPTVGRISKIDPEAFWNNGGTSQPFTLTGSYKKGNQFYGTSNNEILKGEGSIGDVLYICS